MDLHKKCRGCLEANGFCAFRKVYIHDAWKLMPVNYTMHFIDECSDENAPFKILTVTKKLLLNLNAWNGSSHLWTSPCNFLKNIEMKMTLVKILIKSEQNRKHA